MCQRAPELATAELLQGNGQAIQAGRVFVRSLELESCK